MISLPSKWTKKFNLKKGDDVEVEEDEDKIIISKETSSSKKSTKIKLKDSSDSIIRAAVINAYRAGYDLVEIEFDDEKAYKAINQTIQDYVLGFDITKKEKNKVVIENITEPSADQFENLFQKVFYNISNLIDYTEKRLKGEPSLESYEEISYRIYKYENFCRRVMVKRNLFGSSCNLFWSFAHLMTHGQRELYHLNRFLDKNNVKFNNFEIITKLKKLFSLLHEAYQKKDISKIEEVHRIGNNAIYHDLYDSIQKGSKENIILYHLGSSIRNFYLASSSLTGLLLESKSSV